MSGRIPIAGPWITEVEVQATTEAAANGWYERAGHYVQQFEEAFQEYLGVKHAMAVPHCTSAIHLALAAMGVREGDEVIVPDITWIASAAPARYVGATTVFADIEEDTWCISTDSLRACITERTKAIVPVALYGLMPDMDAIREVAREHGLHVVEDAAQAIGSKFRGRLAGTFGDVGVFSFHGSKTMTTGEGGMFVTNETSLYERAMQLRDHGRTKSSFYNTEVAFKYRMSSVQAALGRAQLSRIDQLVGKKRQLFAWYRERLGGVDGVRLNVEPEGRFNTYWMTTVIVGEQYGLTSRDLMAALAEVEIDVRPFFHPLSALPAYSDTPEARSAAERNEVAYRLSPRGVNLPSALRLTEADVDRVCNALIEILGRATG